MFMTSLVGLVKQIKTYFLLQYFVFFSSTVNHKPEVNLHELQLLPSSPSYKSPYTQFHTFLHK